MARYGLNNWVQRTLDLGFPWGLLVTNSIGCFVFGLVWSLEEQRGWMSPDARLVVLVGFLGAFTTLSTFAFDTVHLARSGEWVEAVGNLILTNTLAAVLVLAGIWLGKAS